MDRFLFDACMVSMLFTLVHIIVLLKSVTFFFPNPISITIFLIRSYLYKIRNQKNILTSFLKYYIYIYIYVFNFKKKSFFIFLFHVLISS